MKTLTQNEAQQIADKLEATIQGKRGHARVYDRWGGRIVASYGIRRSSRAVGHDFIPHQLFITFRQTVDLARCPLTKEGFFEILRSKGKLPG